MRWMLILAMLFSVLSPVAAGAEERATLPVQLVEEQTIGEGITLQRYDKKISGQNSRVFVIKVDLTNPYAQVRPLYGKGGTFAEKQTVEAMAKEKGAIAAINADFFNMKDNTPFGIVVDQGEIISSMGRMPYWHSLGILQDNTAIIDRFTYQGKVTAPSGATFNIQGVNKQEYQSNGYASHRDQINLYTPAFGRTSLGALKGYDDYVEVVVQDHTVLEVRIKQPAAVIPANGYVLWGHGSGAKFLQEQFKPGDPVVITSTHVASTNIESLQSAMAGYLLLVDNGKPLSPMVQAIKGKFSRSAVGISQDGKTLYLAAVEGPPNGRGMELVEWAVVMKEIGSYKAFNLDGGGSTTIVARKLADTEISLLNNPAYGTQRKVPTAIGVFNTAPQGALKGFFIDGPDEVVKGAEAEFKVKGYDEHYHPFAINPAEVTWSATDAFTGNKLLALTSGQQEVTAEYNGVKQTKSFRVIGASDVAQLIVEPSVLAVEKGQSRSFTVKIKTKAGKLIDITPHGASATVPSGLGTVDGFTFTGGNSEAKGVMTVNFDGITVSVPVSVGSVAEPLESFERITGLYHTAVPKELANKGSFQTVTEQVYKPGKSARLKYNFSGAAPDEVRISYGVLGSQPIPLPGTPVGLGLWVYGDNSRHWLRAEIVDANGKVHYMDLAKEINFSGWNQVKGVIPPAAVYPVKLKSIYVVNVPEGTEQRPERGTLYFDELTLYQPYDPDKAVNVSAPPKGGEPEQGTEQPGDISRPLEPVNPFKDVAAGSWYEEAVLNLYNGGVIKGISGDRFAPGEVLTRAQFVTLLGKWLGWQDDPALKLAFKDQIPAYAVSGVKTAVAKGIAKGFPGNQFKPDAPLTRAQMTVMLYLALKDAGYDLASREKKSFADEGAIPAWAKEAVDAMSSKGYIKGIGNSFKPELTATRAQAAVLLYQLKK